MKYPDTMDVRAKELMEEPSESDVRGLHELVDASLRFTTMLKKKGVSQATLMVAVRNRPLSRRDRSQNAVNLTRVIDDKIVVVRDPKEDSAQRYGDARDAIRPLHSAKPPVPGQGITDREKQYVFDRAFDIDATNQQVYKHVVQAMIAGLLRGLNATVFAYGATGSGKTHTMVGTEKDPGLMVLSMKDIFRHIAKESDKNWEVTCSYLEVYNEEIYDLLASSSKPLDLREDPDLGATVAGLRRIEVTTPEKIFSLLKEGNRRRKTESTDANATSSRSHAVLEVTITRMERNHYEKQVSMGKLALVDLAGSERASETNNRGQQLKDGANINRSLLALANCINALGKRRKKAFVFVPFRNSKLTRLLKDGLCGNSRTAMVATVSCASTQYHHTINTLKYADRAKEIKTHVRHNQGTVQEHIVEYQRIIDSLKEENAALREQLSVPTSCAASLRQAGPLLPQDKEPGWVEQTSAALNAAAVERLKQHRDMEAFENSSCKASVALAAVEAEMEARARPAERREVGDAAARLSSDADLEQRRHELSLAVEAGKKDHARISAKVAETEAERTGLMAQVAAAAPGEGRERLKLEAAAARRELERIAAKEMIGTCDDIIREQAAVISNLWKVLRWAGVSRSQAFDIAAEQAGHPGAQQQLEQGALGPDGATSLSGPAVQMRRNSCDNRRSRRLSHTALQATSQSTGLGMSSLASSTSSQVPASPDHGADAEVVDEQGSLTGLAVPELTEEPSEWVEVSDSSPCGEDRNAKVAELQAYSRPRATSHGHSRTYIPLHSGGSRHRPRSGKMRLSSSGRLGSANKRQESSVQPARAPAKDCAGGSNLPRSRARTEELTEMQPEIPRFNSATRKGAGTTSRGGVQEEGYQGEIPEARPSQLGLSQSAWINEETDAQQDERTHRPARVVSHSIDNLKNRRSARVAAARALRVDATGDPTLAQETAKSDEPPARGKKDSPTGPGISKLLNLSRLRRPRPDYPPRVAAS